MTDLNHLLQLILDLIGTFAFALNGAMTAVRIVRLDVVGVLTVGIVTAIGGGIVRDVVIGATPPSGFADWRYIAVAAGGAALAFLFGHRMSRYGTLINAVDAAGLALFAVTGTTKALAHGLGPVPAALLGVTTAVGGGTIRDMMVGRVPVILRRELYAVPALLAAVVTVVAWQLGLYGLVAAVIAASLCLALRLVSLARDWNAPGPRGAVVRR